MLSIYDDVSLLRTLELSLDPQLRDLIHRRRTILGTDQPFADMAHFLVVQSGDRLEAIEAALGLSIRVDPFTGATFGQQGFFPAWEWVLDHGYCYETVFVLSDDGYAKLLFVEQVEGVDPELLEILQAFIA